MSAARPSVAVALLTSVTALAAATLSSCASKPDNNAVTEMIVPDFDIYIANVDQYLTRRCGSLDCHGQPGRAYRIYSREGQRLGAESGLISGLQPTTEDEKLANFEALVALEPELMTTLMARQGVDPNVLMFLRKPLKLERHKGGPAMAVDDPGYRCVVAWLQIPVVDADGNPIDKGNRAKLSANGTKNCQEAASFP